MVQSPPEGQTRRVVVPATPGRGFLCAQGRYRELFRSVAPRGYAAGRKIETRFYGVADRQRYDSRKEVGRAMLVPVV